MRTSPGNNLLAMGRLVSCWRTVCLTLICVAGIGHAQDPNHPLKPADRSSPRAALRTFLEAGDTLGAFLAREYIPSPSRAKFEVLLSEAKTATESLDLSEVAPAARVKRGRAAALALYETLCRIELPPFEAIPNAVDVSQTAATNSSRWVIPNTEIVLVRAENGPHQGEFLFSSRTVAEAAAFYERVRDRAYARPVPLPNLKQTILSDSAGWMIPTRWIQAMPGVLRVPIAEQATWKWIAMALGLVIFALPLRIAYRISRRGSDERPFLQALAQLVLPAFLLLAAPAFSYLTLTQLNLLGNVGGAIELAETAVIFLAAAWICWRLAPVVAEAIIASPQIPTEGLDAHLIRICARLLGIIAGISLLAFGIERLGMPLYGIVAGVGVGGLAVALAAQSTIENLIGGLSLFADKPIRVGDFCKYGEKVGTVEAIGIRSTRLRGPDRTLTTIPNAALSKMPVVNYTVRDRMLLKCVIGVRYETTPDQLRYLLVKMREMLAKHPRIDPEAARVRFNEFGVCSLSLEVFAYVTTRDWAEFLGIREDVFLRIMEIINESGTSLAFPSQTLYFGRDDGLNANRTHAAEAQVRKWRDQGRLLFPDFAPETKDNLRTSVSSPPNRWTDPEAKIDL